MAGTLLTLATVIILDSGVQCRASLSLPEDAPQQSTQILLNLGGSGLYSSVDMGPPALFEAEMASGRTAYLAVDKPGVLGMDGEQVEWDLEAFSSYRPDDLVGCTQGALTWARQQAATREDGLILLGHSEGSLVLLNLVSGWEKAQAEQVDLLVLSGTPLQGMEAVLTHQWGTRRIARRLRKEQRREAEDPRRYVREGPGISTAGLEAWMASPDPEALMMATLKGQIPTLVQHGLRDDAVPPDALMTWAAAVQVPWLCVQLYNAGHNGDLSMVVARMAWIDAALGLSPRGGFLARWLATEPEE